MSDQPARGTCTVCGQQVPLAPVDRVCQRHLRLSNPWDDDLEPCPGTGCLAAESPRAAMVLGVQRLMAAAAAPAPTPRRIVVDADAVLADLHRPHPGALEALSALRQAGHTLVLLVEDLHHAEGWGMAARDALTRLCCQQRAEAGAPYPPAWVVLADGPHLLHGDVLVHTDPDVVQAWAAAQPGRVAYLSAHRADLRSVPTGMRKWVWSEIQENLAAHGALR